MGEDDKPRRGVFEINYLPADDAEPGDLEYVPTDLSGCDELPEYLGEAITCTPAPRSAAAPPRPRAALLPERRAHHTRLPPSRVRS